MTGKHKRTDAVKKRLGKRRAEPEAGSHIEQWLDKKKGQSVKLKG